MFAVEAAINTGILQYYMTGEDVVLSEFLTANSVPDYKDVTIIIEEATVIGGTGEFALHVDDVSAWSNILIENYGEIQGAAGSTAVKVAEPITFINDGYAANDPNASVIAGTSNVTLHNMVTGKLLPGGGDGGNGGAGGRGNSASWAVSDTLIKSGDRHTHGWGTSPDMSVWWANTAWHVYNGSPGWIYWFTSAPNGGNIWSRGYKENIPGSHWYAIKYGTYTWGTAGAGGAGGKGQGYQVDQATIPGSAGTSGTKRSGSGGAGGDGGDWGQDGVDKSNIRGGAGYRISTSTYDEYVNGSKGTAGTLAGISINF